MTAAQTANTNTTNDQDDAQIAALDNGQFVIVWTENDATSGGDGSFTSVKMQVFDANGNKVGPEVLVNSQFTFEQENPTVTVLSDFRFVVTWQDRSQTGTDTQGYSIHSRIYDARIAGIDLEGGDTADQFVGSDFADSISGLAGLTTSLGARAPTSSSAVSGWICCTARMAMTRFPAARIAIRLMAEQATIP